ncbi:MAG: stage II sporulation protein D, partial [Halanaerobiales bacterium]
MWGKTWLLLLIIFIVIIIVPIFFVQEFFWGNNSETILKVYNHKTKSMEQIELEEYIRGVLAAEMPALYHHESLKAQAVAARTYTLKQLPEFGGTGSRKYAGADVSTDYTDCQAYLTENEMKEKWGFISYFYYWFRINNAVEETRGEVLLYNNRLIDAVYHANSGGKTEAAEYVWGNNVSYLKSITSPYDKDGHKNYSQIIVFNENELISLLGINHKDLAKIEILEVSKSGRILNIKIGNKVFTGREMRSKLTLPSTKFYISRKGNTYSFKCMGRGHGVGMSQDGANGLAKHGYTYQQ